MKRTYAAARLLEHGPLTFAEFVDITRWRPSTADRTLRELRGCGVVAADRLPATQRGNPKGNHVYRLASHA